MYPCTNMENWASIKNKKKINYREQFLLLWVLSGNLILSFQTTPAITPHSCGVEVLAFLNRWSTAAQERWFWPGSNAKSCQQKALQSVARVEYNGPEAGWISPHSPSSWPRTNRAAYTAAHTDNKWVPRHNEAEMENPAANDQNQPKCDSQTSFVEAPVWHLMTPLMVSLNFWWEILRLTWSRLILRCWGVSLLLKHTWSSLHFTELKTQRTTK